MVHSLVDTAAEYIERHGLLTEGDRVLVGVSGGADSMVCLAVLHRLGYDVQALHVNYGLREGADADEVLVRRWCLDQSPSVPLTVEYLDAQARADANNESLQEAARELRYDALTARAEAIEAAAVATGHHRDDQAETVLLNLVRGSGPEGLAGMPPSRFLQHESRIRLVRPLLDVDRAAIEAFAEAEGIPWRTDPTNRMHKYDRGVVRSEVLPLLAEHFEGVPETLARSADLMREYVDHTLTPVLNERMEQAYVDCSAGGRLMLNDLRDEPAVWRRRLLLEALRRALPDAPRTYALADQLDALVGAQVGRRVELGGGTVWRERNGLRFLPDGAEQCNVTSTPVSWGKPISLPQGTLLVDSLDEEPASFEPETPTTAFADADRLGTSLQVRSWAEGDRFQPLGMEGTKRVSTFLTDRKVPPHWRDAVCVLCTPDHIAWVIGFRLDHRVRIRPSTERYARLRLRPHEKPSDDCYSS